MTGWLGLGKVGSWSGGAGFDGRSRETTQLRAWLVEAAIARMARGMR